MADVPVEDAALEDDVPAEGEEEGEGEAEASEDKSVDSSEEEEDEDANEYEDDGFVVDEEEGGEGEDEQEDSARKRRKKSKKRKSLKLDDEDYDLLEENQVKARLPCTPCRACCSCMVSGWAAATLCMAIWAWLLPCKRAMQCIRGPGLCMAIFWLLLGPSACFKGAPCKAGLLLTQSSCARDPVVVI